MYRSMIIIDSTMKIFLILLLFLLLVNSQHQTPSCQDSNTCAQGMACNALGFCTKICTSHSSCENPNMFCDFNTVPNYTCRQRQCVHQNDCLGPSICTWQENYCSVVAWACTSDVHCLQGQDCVISTGKCMETCSSNSDCISCQICNDQYHCEMPPNSCQDDTDCDQGQICNLNEGLCMNEPKKCGQLMNGNYDLCAEGEYCMGFPNRCASPCTCHSDCWFYPNTICEFRPTASVCVPKLCAYDSDCQNRFGTSICVNGQHCSQQLYPCPNDPEQLCGPL